MSEKNDPPVDHVLVDIRQVIALITDSGNDALPDSEYRLACKDMVDALSEFLLALPAGDVTP